MLGGCVALQPRETTLLQQNRYAELREVMEQKVRDVSSAPTGDLVYLCFAYAKIRQYDRLFPCIEQMQTNIDRGDTKLYWFDFSAAPALLRAQALIEFGDYKAAIEQAVVAERLTRPEDAYLQMRIYALSALAHAHALDGDTAGAERAAAALATVDTSYPNTLMASDKYMGLARVYMARGQYRQALDAMQRDDAETAGLKAFADLITGASLAGQSVFAYWDLPKRYIIARARLESGDAAGARQDYDRLLATPGIEQNGDIHWIMLADRGRIAEADGDRTGALARYRRAVDIVEGQRATIRAEAARIGFVGDKQDLYRRLVALLISQGEVAEAFAYVERAKARALVDLLASRRPAARRGAAGADALLAEVDRAERAAAELDPSLPAAEAVRRRSALSDLRSRLAAAAPDLAALVTVIPSTAGEIQVRLPPDETLVEYYGGGDDLFAFVMTRETLTARRLEGGKLREAVAALRNLLEGPEKDPLPAARALHARILAPIADRLRTEKLLIVPHDILHYVPFNALHDGTRYLIDAHALRMLPSASVLRFLPDGSADNGRLLIIGNPSLDLPGAEEEARAIAGTTPGATLLLREQGTKLAVTEMAGRFSRIHFASHGMFLPEAPLDSGLLLAAPRRQDGILRVSELYGLTLEADLVTLSACQTALGAIAAGDDVVGFTRGFLYAGARTIISSLWSVEDRATRDLMIHFYGNLGRGSKQTAFRRAQRAVKEQYRPPFFWAAFQVTGAGS
jgi:CHAT domain-containing protein